MKMSFCYFSVLSSKRYSKYDSRLTSVTFPFATTYKTYDNEMEWRHCGQAPCSQVGSYLPLTYVLRSFESQHSQFQMVAVIFRRK